MQDPVRASNAPLSVYDKHSLTLAGGATIRGKDDRMWFLPILTFVRPARQVRVAAAFGMALIVPSAPAFGAEIPATELRLIVPFPLTGPRDIQGADRATRAYQVIAPHAPSAISEAMSDQITAALAGRGDYRLTRERRSRLTPARLNALVASASASPPTLILGSADAMVIAPYAANTAPRDPARTLTLLAPIAIMPFVLLCARNTCPVAARDSAVVQRSGYRSGFHASSGELSIGHLAAELLRRNLAITSLHVPYNGGNAALSGLAAGQVDWMLAALPLALPHAGRGKVTALGIAASERFALLPDLPTLREAGLGDHVIEGWFAWFAVPNMSATLVTELRERSRHAIRSGLGRTALLTRGLVPSAESDTEFWGRIARDTTKWGSAIDATR